MKKLRRLHEMRKTVGNIVILFWIAETIAFLIIEGWHWKATSPTEIILDKIVFFGIVVWLVLFFQCIGIIIEAVIEKPNSSLE